MRSRSRPRAALVLAASSVAVLAATGCATSRSSYSTSDWRTAPAPQVRAGVGDSLGNALFLRHVQLAKSIQFHTAPTYASELTD